MAEKMYYWGEQKDQVDPDQTFIEFKAKSVGSSRGRETSHAAAKMTVSTSQGRPTEVGNREEDTERGGWDNKLDFLFSCISVSVGLGNVWRFPYLCYKNGGGAFLITYGIAMVFCGIPIFFQEVAIGQYLGAGGMTLVGQLCPLLQGVGYATMTIVFFLDVYYCIIIAWTLFYLISTFVNIPNVPWKGCGNWWNTEDCFDGLEKIEETTDLVNSNVTNSTYNNTVALHHATPVEEYWERRLLGITSGIEIIGGIQWELLGCLVIGWLLVYFIIRRGLHQSGKIIWFSALFPYVVLYSFGKSGDVGGQLQRLAVLRHAEVGGINVAWPMDRRGHANFLRLQHRDRSSARPRIVQQVPSQLLQRRVDHVCGEHVNLFTGRLRHFLHPGPHRAGTGNRSGQSG
uniref:Transporter n=1 Tax=Apis cerana TaxID=7461 RepID=V9IH23_APICE